MRRRRCAKGKFQRRPFELLDHDAVELAQRVEGERRTRRGGGEDERREDEDRSAEHGKRGTG